MKTPQADAEMARACVEAMWAEFAASRCLGMELLEEAQGRAHLVMLTTEQMVNGHGICHAGYIFIMADSAFAFACNTYNERVLASQASISFLRPAHLGERLIAQAEERIRLGRSGIYDVRVCREDGTVIAEFRGHSRMTGHRFFPNSEKDQP